MRKKSAFAILAFALVGLALTPVVRTYAQANVPSEKPMRWLLNGPALETFTSDPVAVRFFAGSKPFIMQRKGASVQLPSSWNAQTIRSFTSYQSIQRAFESGAIDSDVRAVLYDNEVWSFTPQEEQANHGEYSKMAADLVHKHGLLFMTAPAINLTRVLAPGTEKRHDAYIRVNIAADAARYADVFDIQAQGSESDLAEFTSFVTAAAKQAREANPKVIVLAGISTNPSGQKVDAETIVRAIQATNKVVDGYWFNVPQPSRYCPKCNDFRPDMALDVLRKLGSDVPR